MQKVVEELKVKEKGERYGDRFVEGTGTASYG